MHPESQERLREETIEAKVRHGGDLTYDQLVAIPYLDAICRETLRLYVHCIKFITACLITFSRYPPVSVAMRMQVFSSILYVKEITKYHIVRERTLWFLCHLLLKVLTDKKSLRFLYQRIRRFWLESWRPIEIQNCGDPTLTSGNRRDGLSLYLRQW